MSEEIEGSSSSQSWKYLQEMIPVAFVEWEA